jgi:GAF domain-containing protein
MFYISRWDKAYLFGLHQCAYPRAWTTQEQRLFEEIGRRLAEALSTLLLFRTLRESEAQHRVTQVLAEADTLEEAAPRLLQALCEWLVWDLGALWYTNRSAGRS